jgi:hypothetical protein
MDAALCVKDLSSYSSRPVFSPEMGDERRSLVIPLFSYAMPKIIWYLLKVI